MLVKEYQGSKKVLSSSPGQVNFLIGQVTLKGYLSKGQGWVQASHPLKNSLTKMRGRSGFG